MFSGYTYFPYRALGVFQCCRGIFIGHLTPLMHAVLFAPSILLYLSTYSGACCVVQRSIVFFCNNGIKAAIAAMLETLACVTQRVCAGGMHVLLLVAVRDVEICFHGA